jgi:beta-lactamase class A
MAQSARFFRVSLALVCFFGLNLVGPLLNVAQAASPVPSYNPNTSASQASLAVQLSILAPCLSTVPPNLPAAKDVTPANNPDPTASEPGDWVTALQTQLNIMVQSDLNNGLTGASVIIKDSGSGQTLQFNPGQVFSSASLYKIFVLWKVQEEIEVGQLSDDSIIPLLDYGETPADTTDPAPAAPQQVGTISVADARRLMITLSDNASAWSLGFYLGWYNIDAMLRAHGYTDTTIDIDTPVTTAAEVTRFFEELYNHTLDSALTDSDYALMLDLFKAQGINNKLPTGLPDGVTIAHKTGDLDDFNHDAGIIYTPDGRVIFISVMTQGNYDASLDLMQRVAAFAWANVGQRPLPVFFPATQKTVSGQFLAYWQQNGGLATFGLPLDEARLEYNTAARGYFLTQWFERARFEYHPENKGTPYEVLLGLLGSELCQKALQTDMRFLPTAPINNPGHFIYFPETGHNLGNGFLGYWRQNGGLARYGLPISEEHFELNPATGQRYIVQWFERARFEYHPENKGTPYEVLLGLLGTEYSGITQASQGGTGG